MAQTTVEENALVTRESSNGELQQTSASALAQHEIQGAIIVARRFPRSEEKAYAAIIRSCKRTSFANEATYEYTRGDSLVSGPSIYFAREFARVWGNIRHGCYIVQDDEETRTIRCWAWDLETNAKVECDDTFAKLVYRKKGGWVKPDERDLRELTNRRAAIAKRNCILELLPSDMVDDAVAEADATLKADAKKDPEAAKKAMVRAFDTLNVPVAQLEQYLGCPLGQASPAQIAELRKVYKSIADGNSKWAEYLAAKTGASPAGDAAQRAEEKLRTNGHANGNGGAAPPAKPEQPAAEAPPPQPPNEQDEMARDELAEDLRQKIEAATSAAELGPVAAELVKHAEWLGKERHGKLVKLHQEQIQKLGNGNGGKGRREF